MTARAGRNLLVSSLLAIAAASTAVAQFRESLLHLEQDDLKMVSAAAESLYNAQTPKVGDAKSWKNDQTGNSGTVQIVEIYYYQGMPCRKLRHTVKQKLYRDPVIVRIHRCRTPQGEWKIRS